MLFDLLLFCNCSMLFLSGCAIQTFPDWNGFQWCNFQQNFQSHLPIESYKIVVFIRKEYNSLKLSVFVYTTMSNYNVRQCVHFRMRIFYAVCKLDKMHATILNRFKRNIAEIAKTCKADFGVYKIVMAHQHNIIVHYSTYVVMR